MYMYVLYGFIQIVSSQVSRKPGVIITALSLWIKSAFGFMMVSVNGLKIKFQMRFCARFVRCCVNGRLPGVHARSGTLND